jgi:LacI family transcriptional regulator
MEGSRVDQDAARSGEAGATKGMRAPARPRWDATATCRGDAGERRRVPILDSSVVQPQPLWGGLYSITSWRQKIGMSTRQTWNYSEDIAILEGGVPFAIDCARRMLARVSQQASRIKDPAPRSSAKDVARLAGVSTATVSRVLNSPTQVDAATQRAVLNAIAKLGYVPHGAARALRSDRSKMIGAIVPSFSYALYARTTSALQASLDAKGYAMVLAEHHYDLATEVRITDQLTSHGVDAFVFVGLYHDPALFARLERYGRPYVLTWGVDPMRRHPSIGFDNRAATFAMTRHLIGLGHRRFGLLSAPTRGNDRALERGAGVRSALAEAELALDESCVQYGPIDLAAAAGMMKRLLALPDRPTAVIGTNDVFAVGAMLACREAGVRVPDDMSITGVDNTELGASQVPPLTSIRTPIVEIGRAAGEQLIARIEGRPCDAFQTLPFELTLRGSTAPPPGPARRRR